MREPRVASRYAKSLLLLAEERGSLEEVNKDMRVIRDGVRNSKDLSMLINSPVIKADKKGTILKMIFDGKISSLSQDFIDILVRKKREYLVDDMAEAFETQYKLHKNIKSAQVTTAIAMTDDQRSKVLEMVRQMHGDSGVDLVEKVDPEIIGGIILQVGDDQIDESVLRKLQDYRKEFSKNQYVADF